MPISNFEELCMPAWVIPFDNEIGCPEGWNHNPVSCCFKKEFIEFELPPPPPATTCPEEWSYIEELDKCMPDWVLLPTFTLCDGEVICADGFVLSPDIPNTCIIDNWQEYHWLCAEPSSEPFSPSMECEDGWLWIEGVNSCVFIRGVQSNSHLYWWVWDPAIRDCPIGQIWVPALNACLPLELVGQDQTIRCPPGWVWDACSGECVYVGFPLEPVEFCFRCDVIQLQSPNAVDVREELPPFMIVEPFPDSTRLDLIDANTETSVQRKNDRAARCPPSWSTMPISPLEELCMPKWIIPFEEEIGCPEGFEHVPVSCCMKSGWIDFTIGIPPPPEDKCPEAWEFVPELKKCMPEWTLLPTVTLCDGTVICADGFSLSPDVKDTCIMDNWEKYKWLCLQ
jgi:hypothetical protein